MHTVHIPYCIFLEIRLIKTKAGRGETDPRWAAIQIFGRLWIICQLANHPRKELE